LAFDIGLFISSPDQWFSAQAFILYFLTGAIFGAVLAALIVVKKIMPIAAFAYPAARTKAMSGGMLRERKLRQLADSYSYKDIIASFEGTSYEKYVAGKKDIAEIEKGLAMALAEDYSKIVSMAPQTAKPFFKILNQRYSVRNIKSILSAKTAGLKPSIVWPSPLSDAFIQRLSETEGLQESLELLKFTAVGNSVENLNAESGIGKIQRELDRFLFERLFEKKKIRELAEKTGVMNDSENLSKLFGYYIDSLNIKIALRAINSGLNEKEWKNLRIENYFFLSEKNLDAMISLDLQSAAGALEGTPYQSIVAESLKSAGNRKLYLVEKALDRFYSEKIREAYLKQPFGLTPLGAYLLLKENEIKTLFGILNGVQEGIPKEKIKELFIGA